MEATPRFTSKDGAKISMTRSRVPHFATNRQMKFAIWREMHCCHLKRKKKLTGAAIFDELMKWAVCADAADARLTFFCRREGIPMPCSKAPSKPGKRGRPPTSTKGASDGEAGDGGGEAPRRRRRRKTESADGARQRDGYSTLGVGCEDGWVDLCLECGGGGYAR